MGLEIMDNSDKMREHMKSVKVSNCSHKPKKNELGALVNPVVCDKCGFKIKEGLVVNE